jgi:hypothetical protein
LIVEIRTANRKILSIAFMYKCVTTQVDSSLTDLHTGWCPHSGRINTETLKQQRSTGEGDQEPVKRSVTMVFDYCILSDIVNLI